MSGDVAGPLGLFCGYLALVVWIVWPSNHDCHDPRCDRKERDRIKK